MIRARSWRITTWEVLLNRFLFCPMALLFAGLVSGQTDGSLDRVSLAKLRQEAFEDSQASPAHKRGAEFARDRLASYGLQNARLEPSPTTRNAKAITTLLRWMLGPGQRQAAALGYVALPKKIAAKEAGAINRIH